MIFPVTWVYLRRNGMSLRGTNSIQWKLSCRFSAYISGNGDGVSRKYPKRYFPPSLFLRSLECTHAQWFTMGVTKPGLKTLSNQKREVGHVTHKLYVRGGNLNGSRLQWALFEEGGSQSSPTFVEIFYSSYQKPHHAWNKVSHDSILCDLVIKSCMFLSKTLTVFL